MGRPRQALDAVADDKDIRTRLKEKGVEAWQRQRLQAVRLGLAGKLSLPDIADEAGVSPRTVGEWFERFRDGGIESLLTRKEKGKGPSSWLSGKALQDFRNQVAQGKWRKAEEARQWLQNRLGRKLSIVVVYKYLGKMAARRDGVITAKAGAGAKKTSAPAKKRKARK
jgi:transposase